MIMKKFHTTILLSVLTAVLGSCWQEYIAPEDSDEGYLVLSLVDGDMAVRTKVASDRTQEDGDDTYHENAIDKVDCFFYSPGASGSNAGYTALGYAAARDGDDYKVRIRLTDEFLDIFSGDKCEVFVIANSNLTYGGSTDVTSLRNLELETDFSATQTQSHFIMYSDTGNDDDLVTITLTTDGESHSASGTAPMKRSAAKIQLYMRISGNYHTSPDDGKIYIQDNDDVVWQADIDGSITGTGPRIRLSSGMKRTYLAGDYVPAEGDMTDYITYEYHEFDGPVTPVEAPENRLDSYVYTHIPFYSYPFTWKDNDAFAANLLIEIPWVPNGNVAKTERRLYQVSANSSGDDGRQFKHNWYYRLFLDIHTLGGLEFDHTVMINCSYIVIPWIEESKYGTSVEDIFGEFTKYTYLVIDESIKTVNSQNNASFSFISSSNLEFGEDKTMITKVTYYDFNLENPEVVAQYGDATYDTWAKWTTFLSGKGISIDNGTSPGTVAITHSLEGVYCQYRIEAQVANTDGYTDIITLIQNPSIYMSMAYGGDVFVDGYFAQVTDATMPGAHGVVEYVRTSSDEKFSIGVFSSAINIDGTSTKYRTNNYSSNNHYVASPYGYLYYGFGSAVNLSTLTRVIVTAFNSSNNRYLDGAYQYIIGDPRIPSGWSAGTLARRLTGQSNIQTHNYSTSRCYYCKESDLTFEDWTEDPDILVTSDNDDAKSLIAPDFFVSSQFGRMSVSTGGDHHTNSYDDAVKRCATYQESGFPAGRWRLPTEAEIFYIYQRQSDGTIPALFVQNSNRGYWAGSGRYFSMGNFYSSIPSGTIVITRCVYDAWYWGDTPEDPRTYHVMPTR